MALREGKIRFLNDQKIQFQKRIEDLTKKMADDRTFFEEQCKNVSASEVAGIRQFLSSTVSQTISQINHCKQQIENVESDLKRLNYVGIEKERIVAKAREALALHAKGNLTAYKQVLPEAFSEIRLRQGNLVGEFLTSFILLGNEIPLKYFKEIPAINPEDGSWVKANVVGPAGLEPATKRL